MNLITDHPDPLNILSSTKKVLEGAQFVFIDEQKIKEASKIIQQKLERGLESAETSFGMAGNYQKNVQLIFLENAVNFCFWAERGEKKWQVEDKSNQLIGGWCGLKTCFEKALKNSRPILDAAYLAEINEEGIDQLFQGADDSKIPLIKERQKNLQEAGRVMRDKYQGQFINALEEANYDAIKLTRLLRQAFHSFDDTAELNGQKINFLKRAQICPNDISYLKDRKIDNLEHLTAFADYRLPQILRELGTIIYADGLVKKIDQLFLIPQNSREEIEIRAATIWTVELIRQAIPQYTAGQIDNAIWLLSQKQEFIERAEPHHRTYSVYY